MEYDLVLLYTGLAVGILTLISMLKRANEWFITLKCSDKYHLPPGDMGWPLVGNMLFFFQSFKDGNLLSFVSYFSTRFGPGGMYKAFMFGNPTIIVTRAETSRKILMDNGETFDRGMPSYVLKILGQDQGGGEVSKEEMRRYHGLIAPVKSSLSLSSNYIDCVKETVKSSFEKLSAMEEPVDILSALKKPVFEVFIGILLGGGVHQELLHLLFDNTIFLIRGCQSLPINIPGFAYNKAIKARREIVKIFQQILDERKLMMGKKKAVEKSNNILDIMLNSQVDDDEGGRFSDEEIIIVLVAYTFAGFEPVAVAASRTIMYLAKHPHFLQKAKEEQEDIVKRRSSSNGGLNFQEIRQMKYLSNVIDESLRLTVKTIFFQEAKTTVNINGYTIPKGWKFLSFSCNNHLDPHTFVRPHEFNPSRWDDLETKPSSYIPFGVGPKMCPGANLARLELAVILHYFLLYYRVEQLNPASKIGTPENNLVRFKKLSAS